MFLEAINSKVFGSADARLESALKNPNQFREAVLFEELSDLPQEKLDAFVKSPEAKTMVDKGYISQDCVERLAHHKHKGKFQAAILHMAKEENDPLWDEIVKHHIEERRLMNELIEKYKDKAEPIMKHIHDDFVKPCIPAEFRPSDHPIDG